MASKNAAGLSDTLCIVQFLCPFSALCCLFGMHGFYLNRKYKYFVAIYVVLWYASIKKWKGVIL